MVDLHCHILPKVDDGALDCNMSFEMAKKALSEGITIIIATPHHQNGRYLNEKKDILQYTQDLNRLLEKEQVPLTVLPGQETRLYGEILQDYQKGKILTLNDTNKYLFIEFPSSQVPRYTEKLLFKIQSQGLIPIIVHPERNSHLIEEPDLLYNFVNRGALAQVTAGSVTGYFGKKIKKFSHQLIESNLVHFVSSDAHNLENRSFHMREALEVMKSEHGQDTVYAFLENAQYVVDGQICFKEPPEKIKKKKFLGIF
ncbi:tyrosine-protein phosphatase [Priestia megaterium]|uniref:Tyrosine-protein phosphatase n=1 Tax=Priestia megaterium (strain DSM 319 / IMG 1521) TaxID=592022 RepID=D5DBK4_PRIM3|nr:CpsB/CapC family capsule biosynthesis tyrosine phosphatase [Priestia megaterium]ADF37986.1 putative tyrosine-protein phosphatase capC [Priestia megaterium DSM 319]MED4217260.1 tyrosine protein phosphatase [Priestia megaterium]WEZ37233.1 tyrosine protein phosphatase [Priestia megaterium DSM 319]